MNLNNLTRPRPMQRFLEPEWVDRLPADDPRAMRLRRDLRWVNALMMHAGIMARAIIKHCGDRRPRILVDLGAGDGTFTLRIAQRLAPRWQDVTVILVDQRDIVDDDTCQRFAALKWKVELVNADVFEFMERPRPSGVDVIISNLFLHHFPQEQLSRLLAHAAQSAWLFVACEPRRATWVREAGRLLWLFGCNDGSRHDAVASARAGFDGKELSMLWPRLDQWETHEHAARLFTHCFAACRVDRDHLAGG